MWRFVGGRLATDFSKNCRGFVFKEPEKNIPQIMVCCRFVHRVVSRESAEEKIWV